MPFLSFVLVPAICFLLAIVIGRWWILLLPVAVWALYFFGSYFGWWGVVGDYWYVAMLGHIAVGVAVVAVGLALRWLIARAGPIPSRANTTR